MKRSSTAHATPPSSLSRFDAAYYQRFYLDPETRVYEAERHAHLVAGVVNLVEWLNGPLHGVLDVGAGVGWWGQWLAKHRPELYVLSTELEPETCARYGHLPADIVSWRLPFRFDLVINQGVLPYLGARDAKKAIGNLAAMCDGFLYLEAVTREDQRTTIDPQRTDAEMHFRPARWYRDALAPFFDEVGAGLWARRDAELPLYALERAAPPGTGGRRGPRR